MADADLAMSCTEMVELLTDYLDGALDEHDTERFETHLGLCPGCVIYLDQFRETVQTAGALKEADVADEVMAELLTGFREWKTERE